MPRPLLAEASQVQFPRHSAQPGVARAFSARLTQRDKRGRGEKARQALPGASLCGFLQHVQAAFKKMI